jgi:hypothetical protein
MKISIKALSPISHGAFTEGADTGNIQEFRKMPVINNGAVVTVPTISGNALRGVLRRMIAREFIDKLGLKEQIQGKAFDKFYTVIANGGTLGKDLDVSVRPEMLRQHRAKMPILSVFGSACYKYMMGGMVTIGFNILNCSELGNSSLSIMEQLTDISETRMIDTEIVDKEQAEVKPMPYIQEVVVAGAEFSGSYDFLPQATSLEKILLCTRYQISQYSRWQVGKRLWEDRNHSRRHWR